MMKSIPKIIRTASVKHSRPLAIGVMAFMVVMILLASYGIIQLVELRAHKAANKVVSEVVNHIDDKITEVETVTRGAAVEASAHLDEPETLERLVRDFVEQNVFIYGSTVAFEPDYFPERGYSFAPYSWKTPNGEVHSRQLGTETDYYGEEWYAETKLSGQEYWCEPYFDEGGAKIMMCTFSIPLKDKKGNFAAIMTADVGLDDLEEYISSITPNPEACIILRSKKGTPLVNAEVDSVGSGSNIFIKGMSEIGWSVELMMTLSYLMRGDKGNFLVIGLILLFTVLVVYLINIFINKYQQRASREQREQLEKALSMAKAASNAKTSFLFNMSHDIRTPMNAITGFTAMAKKYADNKDVTVDYLNKIDLASHQLLMLINQVLEMSRIESGKIELNERPVNVKERFDSMVTILMEQTAARGLKFNPSIKDIEHFNVLADDTRMGQITLNIVGNAIKYTPEGGQIDFSIREVPARKEGFATYVFTVADTGIGMSKEYLETLYEPFSRENSSTVSRIQGTGLGMSIVKSLVDLGGGKIDVQSELGKGTRFDVTMDFRINDQTAESASKDSSDNNMAFNFTGKRALLVEDNEMNREIAKFLLRDKGVEVEEAEDGDIAVKIIESIAGEGDFHHYDFILMDIQMPRMNGYEATRSIRNILDPLGIHIPIIAVSANAFEEDRQQSLDAGMDGHVAKPIDIEQLWETLSKFLK